MLLAQHCARIAGPATATISAVADLFWMPYSPLRAVLVIALEILVIKALTSYGPAAHR